MLLVGIYLMGCETPGDALWMIYDNRITQFATLVFAWLITEPSGASIFFFFLIHIRL